MAVDTVRLQFDVSSKRLGELEHVMELCQLSTKKELFNNALVLFEWAVKECQEGNVIASVNEQQKRYRELQMPPLAAAAKAGLDASDNVSAHTDNRLNA